MEQPLKKVVHTSSTPEVGAVNPSRGKSRIKGRLCTQDFFQVV